jgi:hypothetical protein
LSALSETFVQIGTNNALIQLRTANVLHAIERILAGVVLDEAEAAGCFLEAIEAHDQALDLAASAQSQPLPGNGKSES